MKLDLSEIARRSGARAEHRLAENFAEEKSLAVVGPVTGILRATNTGSWLVLEGSIQGELDLTCSRCLRPFRWPIKCEIHEQFRVERGQLTGEFADGEPGEQSPFLEGNVLLVEELAHEALVLATPLQPICRTECPGLCQHCGKNLNDGDCGCEQEHAIHPLGDLARRWEERKQTKSA